LTHCLRPGVLAWREVKDFDRRLSLLGVKLIMLQASPEVVWTRSIKARTTWSFLRNYMSKFGRTDEELHKYFMNEQEQFTEMFEQSAMRKLLVPNDGILENITDTSYQFWRGTINPEAVSSL
jgi:hypothetical protein